LRFANFINTIANKHIGFFIPVLLNSGGMYVILKHACILKDEGWDVDFILPKVNINLYEFQEYKFNVINLNNTIMNAQYDIIVATLYTTVYPVLSYYKAKKHLYLVQGYETDFHKSGSHFRIIAEQTYSSLLGVEYITVSKWCKSWLYKKYGKKVKYAPNGIDLDNIIPHKRNLNKKK
jgi:glycosyltransferase involved in cell wall biosynthesis